MVDFLEVLIATARENINGGYYRSTGSVERIEMRSLKNSINSLDKRKIAVISEIKFASPSIGILRRKYDIESISRDMVEAGAIGISVLTEPKHFMGSLENLRRVRLTVGVPLLMKDIILSTEQIDAAWSNGADAVLLILSLFKRGYCDVNLSEMIEYAHSYGLEVLLETHTIEEFKLALSTEADIIGINNRDLNTLKVDINVTKNILEKFGKSELGDKPVVSESGIKSPEDVRFLKKYGVDAFLVGSAVMTSDDIKGFISRLVNSYGDCNVGMPYLENCTVNGG